MSSREIIVCSEVGLVQDEQNRYIVSKPGYKSYVLKADSRTGLIVRILDNRCLSQQRRYACANDVIVRLESRLERIENSGIYKFFHKLGLI